MRFRVCEKPNWKCQKVSFLKVDVSLSITSKQHFLFFVSIQVKLKDVVKKKRDFAQKVKKRRGFAPKLKETYQEIIFTKLFHLFVQNNNLLLSNAPVYSELSANLNIANPKSFHMTARFYEKQGIQPARKYNSIHLDEIQNIEYEENIVQFNLNIRKRRLFQSFLKNRVYEIGLSYLRSSIFQKTRFPCDWAFKYNIDLNIITATCKQTP